VILITGSNLDRRMWDREALWLSRTHTVVRYDLRAHGESDTATGVFSHLGDLVGVRDALQIPKATLIGLMENDRLWTVDPALMKGPLVAAINRLESVRVPTLILIGEKDELQREQAGLLAKRVPRAKLVRVRGGGRLLNLSDSRPGSERRRYT